MTAAPPFRVLVVDDEELYAEAVARQLGRRGIRCDLACSGADALRAADASGYDVVLLDHRLPDEDGISLIPVLRARHPETSVVMMTAHQTIPNAVQAIRLGAEDYVVKESSLEALVERVLEIRNRCALRASCTGWQEHKREGLLGSSPAMAGALADLEKLSRSPETTVLLTGETGVGKEVAARHLHRLSRPAGSPMVAVDCIALPETLAESILFGHERGAFTGADRTQTGAFEEAGCGTVFLDEVGDMDIRLQGKLLRVLDTRQYQRLGSHKPLDLEARVVAATNRDLGQMVDQGAFRADLYQRLTVFPVHIPPLRDRGDDVLLLAEHFRAFFADKLGKQIAPLGGAVAARLREYPFPGNVRELKNVIERAVVLADEGRLEVRHLPERLLAHARPRLDRPTPTPTPAPVFEPKPGPDPVEAEAACDTLEVIEKRMIRQAMQRSGNIKTEAARLLGISRFQLLRRMEKYGIRTDDR